MTYIKDNTSWPTKVYSRNSRNEGKKKHKTGEQIKTIQRDGKNKSKYK